MASLRTFVFSLQTKLVLAMTLVILLALGLAGTVFVVRERDDRRDQALSRVAAASPAIYQQAFFAILPDAAGDDPFTDTLTELAIEQDVRILILGPDGMVIFDTGHNLGGETVDVPTPTPGDLQRGFVAWSPSAAFPERNVTFVSASSRFVASRTGRELPFRIVLAVQSDTIAEAWRGILPGIGLAAAVAIPLAALAAMLLARQVAYPVRKLTEASAAMAQGDFDQRVELDRDDEIGRLARSFSLMAERVGERDAQMRALLANVSHDLKTPLTSITGYSQSLSDGTAGPDDAARIGQIIREEAEHVNALLSDLLFLGEIDAGQVLTRREDVALDAIISRCLRRVEPSAAARSLVVQAEIDPEVVLHNVDEEKIERAVTNLLDNAVKFTPPHGRVDIKGWSVGSTVHCAVTNTGASIPEDDVPRLFDRFFRGDRARRTSPGSGLGLAITHELVELNGGAIVARNEPGGRVTFEMTLPAVSGGA